MTFDEIFTQVLALLQRDGRVSYRALKGRFDLDEEYLEDLKAEIIQAKNWLSMWLESWGQHTPWADAATLYRAMDMTFWLPQAEAALAQVA